MGRKVLTRSLCLIIFLLVLGFTAMADSINLQNASLTAGGSNVLSLSGTGLSLQVNFQPPAFPDVNHQDLTTVTIAIKPQDVIKTPLIIDGVDYSGSRLAGTATFSVDLTDPMLAPKFGVLDTRTITGTLAVLDAKTGATLAILDFEFTAKVDVSLAGDPCGCYYITDFSAQGSGKVRVKRFDNAPVPEPATLFLLGSGLAAIGLRARKKKPVDDQVA